MTAKADDSRPALRKSVDAEVHPALAGRPGTMGRRTDPGTRTPPVSPPGKKLEKPVKPATTADVLRVTKKNPAVQLTVVLPKSLRRELKAAARSRGLKSSELAAQYIAERLQHDV